jgi:hypothetical protein
MRSTDRLLVVLSCIVAFVSLALHLGPRSGGPGGEAHAASAPERAGDLGPADAVVLRDAKPARGADADVRLRVEGGRVAWNDRATSKAWSIAAVHVDVLMKALLNGSTYADKRKELEDEAIKQEEEFRRRIAEARARFEALPPQSPDAIEAQAAGQRLIAEFNRFQDGSMRIREKVFAEQIEAAYRELVVAVENVADKEGIDIVVRFTPTARPFETDSALGAREAVVSRTFLRSPEIIDITDAVRDALGLPGE